MPIEQHESEAVCMSEAVGIWNRNRRRHHLANALDSDELRPTLRLPAGEEEARHRQHFAHGRSDVAPRPEYTRQIRHRRHERPLLKRPYKMTCRYTVPVHLLTPTARRSQPKRVKQTVLYHLVPWLAVEHFHDARKDGIAQSRAVRHRVAQRVYLWRARGVVHATRVDVVTLARITEHLLKAVGMTQ